MVTNYELENPLSRQEITLDNTLLTEPFDPETQKEIDRAKQDALARQPDDTIPDRSDILPPIFHVQDKGNQPRGNVEISPEKDSIFSNAAVPVLIGAITFGLLFFK